MKIGVVELRRKFVGAVERFPFAFAAAAAATAALVLIADPGRWHREAAEKFLATSALGFPAFLALALYGERQRWPRDKTVFFNVLLAVLIIAGFFGLPDALATEDRIRIGLLGAAAVLLATLAPFPGRGEVNGFWLFNRAVGARVLFAAFLTQTLFAGVAAALAGIDYLFGISVPGSLYLELWGVVSIFGGAIVFLRGVPERPWELDAVVDDPRRLVLFNRFILVPLVALYLVILYVYAGKIAVQARWPQGGVAGFVLGFSAAGILAYVLVAPARGKAEGKLVPLFTRWFFPLVLPLTVLLFLSVWRRIAEYGVTESRYFGVLAALWLAAISVHFAIGRTASIKAIPAILALLAIVSSFGPWGASGVSHRSQAARLERLLARNGLLAAGRVRKAPQPVPAAEAAEIGRTVRYLADRRALRLIAPWFGADLDDAAPQEVVARLGLRYDPYDSPASAGKGERVFSIVSDRASPLEISGYARYMVLDTIPGWNDFAGGERRGVGPPRGTDMRQPVARLALEQESGRLSLESGGATLVAADLVPLVRRLLHEYPDRVGSDTGIPVPREKLTIEAGAGKGKSKIHIAMIQGKERDGRIVILRVKADVLLGPGRQVRESGSREVRPAFRRKGTS